MDYNYFAEPQAQSFQMFSYGNNMAALAQSIDTSASTPFSMDSLSANALLPSTMQSKFDDPLVYDTSILNAHAGNQASADSLTLLQPDPLDGSMSMDFDSDISHIRRGSSEEKDMMTPAQSRRKAQNRAAQRAFRERKERHVRDLEAKLNLLTTTTSSLQSDNERLKMLLQKAQSENEQLRAKAATATATATATTTSPRSQSLSSSSDKHSHTARSASTQSSASEGDRSSVGLSYGSSMDDESEIGAPAQAQLLSASATWDFLQSHPKYTSGVVDVGKVCERLKKLARCNGTGPMFDKEEVRRVIDEAESNGADELL